MIIAKQIPTGPCQSTKKDFWTTHINWTIMTELLLDSVMAIKCQVHWLPLILTSLVQFSYRFFLLMYNKKVIVG